MYRVVSRHPALRMKNDSGSAGFTISTLTCQACIVRPSCSSEFSFSQVDLVLTPDMDFCETHPLPLSASIQLTPSSNHVFKHVPPAFRQFHVYSVAKACQSVLNSVCMELAKILDVKRMSLEGLDQFNKLIAAYSSEEILAVSCTLLTTRPQLLLLTLPFRISPLLSSMPCKSLLRKVYVDLLSILILLLILPLIFPLTPSLTPTQFPLNLTVFTP